MKYEHQVGLIYNELLSEFQRHLVYSKHTDTLTQVTEGCHGGFGFNSK